jgi:hypothetical protein
MHMVRVELILMERPPISLVFKGEQVTTNFFKLIKIEVSYLHKVNSKILITLAIRHPCLNSSLWECQSWP